MMRLLPASVMQSFPRQKAMACGQRMQKDIVAITGDAVDVHDVACLITVGASAVHPYLALATALLQDGEETEHRYRHAVEHGLLKIMAKMGISCVASYCGANVIEVLGLGAEVMELCLPAVPSLIGGSSYPASAAGLRVRTRLGIRPV